MKKFLLIFLLLPAKVNASQILIPFFAYASSCTNNASVGINAWTNPANAQGAADGNYATESGTSQYLYCSQFNFIPQIPNAAVIQGVLAHAWKLSPNSVLDTNVQLFINGSAAGTNKADTVDNWPASITAFSYGSSTDTWGNILNPLIVNSSNFGFGIAIQKNGGGTQTGEVDAMDLTVYALVNTTLNNATIRNATLR